METESQKEACGIVKGQGCNKSNEKAEDAIADCKFLTFTLTFCTFAFTLITTICYKETTGLKCCHLGQVTKSGALIPNLTAGWNDPRNAVLTRQSDEHQGGHLSCGPCPSPEGRQWDNWPEQTPWPSTQGKVIMPGTILSFLVLTTLLSHPPSYKTLPLYLLDGCRPIHESLNKAYYVFKFTQLNFCSLTHPRVRMWTMLLLFQHHLPAQDHHFSDRIAS